MQTPGRTPAWQHGNTGARAFNTACKAPAPRARARPHRFPPSSSSPPRTTSADDMPCSALRAASGDSGPPPRLVRASRASTVSSWEGVVSTLAGCARDIEALAAVDCVVSAAAAWLVVWPGSVDRGVLAGLRLSSCGTWNTHKEQGEGHAELPCHPAAVITCAMRGSLRLSSAA